MLWKGILVSNHKNRQTTGYLFSLKVHKATVCQFYQNTEETSCYFNLFEPLCWIYLTSYEISSDDLAWMDTNSRLI